MARYRAQALCQQLEVVAHEERCFKLSNAGRLMGRSSYNHAFSVIICVSIAFSAYKIAVTREAELFRLCTCLM